MYTFYTEILTNYSIAKMYYIFFLMPFHTNLFKLIYDSHQIDNDTHDDDNGDGNGGGSGGDSGFDQHGVHVCFNYY